MFVLKNCNEPEQSQANKQLLKIVTQCC